MLCAKGKLVHQKQCGCHPCETCKGTGDVFDEQKAEEKRKKRQVIKELPVLWVPKDLPVLTESYCTFENFLTMAEQSSKSWVAKFINQLLVKERKQTVNDLAIRLNLEKRIITKRDSILGFKRKRQIVKQGYNLAVDELKTKINDAVKTAQAL